MPHGKRTSGNVQSNLAAVFYPIQVLLVPVSPAGNTGFYPSVESSKKEASRRRHFSACPTFPPMSRGPLMWFLR